MTEKHSLRSSLPNENDHFILLFTGNKKTLYCILCCTFVLLLAFSVKNYYLGYYALTISLVTFVSLASIDTLCLHKNKTLPFNVSLVAAILVFSLCLTIHHFGLSAAYWAFPVSIVIIYVLPKKPQLILNGILFSFICFASLHYADLATVLRLCLSLFLTIVFSNLIAAHVQQLHHDIVTESIKDPMTGALNRRQLTSHLNLSLAKNKRSNIQSALLMIDIDHFKSVNDTWGHDEGDNVIKSIVLIIKDKSRESDLLFRLGGEEFLLLIHDIDSNTAIGIANKLRTKIANTKIVNNHQVTISVGVSLSTISHTADTWLKHADLALYRAKSLGRNQVQTYSADQTYQTMGES